VSSARIHCREAHSAPSDTVAGFRQGLRLQRVVRKTDWGRKGRTKGEEREGRRKRHCCPDF